MVNGATDNLEQEIIHLINQETDARNKAYLLISFRMHQDLKKNTEATMNTAKQVEGLTTEISGHRVVFDQLRGGWRAVMLGMVIVSGLFGIIQAMGAYIMSAHLELSREGTMRVETIDNRVHTVERELAIIKKQLNLGD